MSIAAALGQRELVDLLLARGARVEARNANGWTALTFAVEHAHPEAVPLLLEHGADTRVLARIMPFGTRGALELAAETGQHALLRALLDQGAEVDTTDATNALYAAAARGDGDDVKLLLDRGLDAWAPTTPRGASSQAVHRALSTGVKIPARRIARVRTGCSRVSIP